MSSSLRPGWTSKGGFQPPGPQRGPGAPPASADPSTNRRARTDTSVSNSNKFALLDEDEDANLISDDAAPAAASSGTSQQRGRSDSILSGGSSKGGRSLADLAMAASSGSAAPSSSPPKEFTTVSSASSGPRYTREKLLALRKEPESDSPPEALLAFQDSSIFSQDPQDPVCFDPFEPDKIWASSSAAKQRVKPPTAEARPSRARTTQQEANRWQRGMALPPPDKKNANANASNPDDLWDDPLTSSADNQNDDDAFGSSGLGGDDLEPFDFEKMAAASAQLEQEIKGTKDSSAKKDSVASESQRRGDVKEVNPKRPLAAAGTTIQSGSGDNVNVFEDFDDPGASPVALDDSDDLPAENQSSGNDASTQLMAMIGVQPAEKEKSQAIAKDSAETRDSNQTEDPSPSLAPWGMSLGIGGTNLTSDTGINATPSTTVPGLNLPLNPWGGTMGSQAMPAGGPINPADLQAQLRHDEMRKAREEEMRRLQQMEEARRLAIAKQQAEEHARQVAIHKQQQEQQAGVQSQVEQVLMERICAILESTWGRAGVINLIQKLHADDPRVIPLLNSPDALRALIQRNPQRAVLRNDPSLGGEIVVLQMTNSQWQEHRQAQMRIQKEEQLSMEASRVRAQMNFNAPWYYSDPQGNIQGPFGGNEMRQWLEAGYFKGDLPISQQPRGPFVPLQTIFSNLQAAFLPPHTGPSAEDIARKEAEEKRVKEEAEKKRKEEEKRQAEAAARKKAEQEARETGDVNKSSTQLKMMLGLGAADAPNESHEPVPAPKTSGNTKKGKKASKPTPEPAAPAQVSPAPAWGASPASQTIPKKSMAEIQKEEARRAAVAAMNKETTRVSSSGWANVAAKGGGSTGWNGAAAKTSPAAVMAGSSVTSLKPAQLSALSNPQASRQNQTTATVSTQPGSAAPSNSTAKAFGAQMSPDLEKWAKDQMLKLNGTDDLTLVSFCMSLTDSTEIRDYLTAYLGSTPQVNNFAGEFINRKNGKAQDEWEMTAATKKKGKKKGGR